jgi:hypothetical protein
MPCIAAEKWLATLNCIAGGRLWRLALRFGRISREKAMAARFWPVCWRRRGSFFTGTVRLACGGMERAGAAALSGGGLSGGWPGVLANRRERRGFYPHGDARPGFFRKNLKKACNMAGL